SRRRGRSWRRCPGCPPTARSHAIHGRRAGGPGNCDKKPDSPRRSDTPRSHEAVLKSPVTSTTDVCAAPECDPGVGLVRTPATVPLQSATRVLCDHWRGPERCSSKLACGG